MNDNYEFKGLRWHQGRLLVRFGSPANANEEGVWLDPNAVRNCLIDNPHDAELLRAFYALEKEVLSPKPSSPYSEKAA